MSPPRQSVRPPNHGSARDRLNILRKNIRKEQDAWRCLVLDADLLEQWPEIIISPFGVVDKGGEDSKVSGRTIHDLSYPEGASINDFTDQDSINKPDYTHCDAVSREILRAKQQFPSAKIAVMTGDVATAFRNISIHSNSVYLVAGRIAEEGAIVIELSAPFGWTGSPGFYEIFGGAITHVHGSHTNALSPKGFFAYQITLTCLRTLDPHAARWTVRSGTPWCPSSVLTPSTPRNLPIGARASVSLVSNLIPKLGKSRYRSQIFKKLAGSSERQLILEFNRGVRNGFDINYRELLSCAFAVHAWGTRWSQQSLSHSRPLHVHFRIDNASAVAWQNKLASRNPRAQVIIRLLSWWETSFRLRFSASHIAGINNVRADAGSRSPADPSFAALFASLNAGWLQ
ncbi:hypothetical protein L917_11119, partial [Phytophthora nicotianae]